MKKSIRWLFGLLLGALSLQASAALNVFACEPEWGALAQELGGDKVMVYSATTARQDPHRVEARPSLIARARSADLTVCTGAELEVGWLPILLTQAGNDKIQPGQSGFFEAASHVAKIEIPQRVDRALGDVHPGGNPHIHLDPRNIAVIAGLLAKRFAELDPANAEYYQSRNKAFSERWEAAIKRWEQQASPIKGLSVIEHHRGFSYLFNWLGIKVVASLEPKPGIEPTTAHLAELLALQQRQAAKMVVRSSYNDPRASEWFAERAKIPAIMLPFTVGGSDKASDLFGLFDDVIARLLQTGK